MMNWITPAQLSERKQNQINCHKKRVRTSRFRGVHFDTRRNKWTAQAFIHKQVMFIGRYDSEMEAAEARDSFIQNNL